MDRQLNIEQGVELLTRQKKKIIRVLIWLIIQILWGVGCVWLNLKLRPHPFARFYAVQWVGIFLILYFQVRAAKLRGDELRFGVAPFKVWNVLVPSEVDVYFLIYKIDPLNDGTFSVWVWYCGTPRGRWINALKITIIKIAVGLRLIK